MSCADRSKWPSKNTPTQLENDATRDATKESNDAGKPTSIKELRKQLRAQLESNQSPDQGKVAQLRSLGNATAQLATLTADQERAINRWLDHIGEHHQPSRDEYLDRCRHDREAREYFLERSKEAIN